MKHREALWSTLWYAGGSGPLQGTYLISTTGLEAFGAFDIECIAGQDTKDCIGLTAGFIANAIANLRPLPEGQVIAIPDSSGQVRHYSITRGTSLVTQGKTVVTVVSPTLTPMQTAAWRPPPKTHSEYGTLVAKKSSEGALAAFVILTSPTTPSSAAINAALAKRYPEIANSSNPADSPSLIHVIGTTMCILMNIDAPNPMSANESFVESAWWWPALPAEITKRRSHVIVSVIGATSPAEGFAILANLAASVLEAAGRDALGVIWEAADAMWKADSFLADLGSARNEVPVPLLVSVKLGRDTEHPKADGTPAWLAMSYGLRAFNLKEIEYRGFQGEPPDLIPLILDLAAYLIKSGPVIKDGETIGPSEKPIAVVRHENSTLAPNTQVYRLYPAQVTLH